MRARHAFFIILGLLVLGNTIPPEFIQDRFGPFRYVVNRQRNYPAAVINSGSFATVPGSVWVQMDSTIDFSRWGEIETNDDHLDKRSLLRRFRVWTPQWHARNVFFWEETVSGSEVFIARLDKTNIIGMEPGDATGQTDLTTAANTDTFLIEEDYDTLPIWNGKFAAISLMTDDGNDENYDTYRFGTGAAQHHFCRICGVSAFRRPRSYPHLFDINARCLEGVDVDSLAVDHFDGEHWEAAEAAGGLDPLREGS